jgi:hypothetical protein
MRVWGNRYSRDLQRYSLAMRMIGHEVRTQTIGAWTGLPTERIRTLALTYAGKNGPQPAVRHRGPSPQTLAFFLRTPHMRSEAAAIAGLCYVLDVLPARPVANARRDLPNVLRGERLCLAFEMYKDLVPHSLMSLEHVVLLVLAIAHGTEIHVEHCVGCDSVIVADRYGLARRSCAHCTEQEDRQRESPSFMNPLAIREPAADGQQALF